MGIPKQKELTTGNVVKTLHIDGCTVHICDDYVAKTPEEIQKVKKEMYSVGWQIVRRLRADGVQI
jgi:hypothetical protein